MSICEIDKRRLERLSERLKGIAEYFDYSIHKGQIFSESSARPTRPIERILKRTNIKYRTALKTCQKGV